MMIDWQMMEVQAIFAGCTTSDKIQRQDARSLCHDISLGLKAFLPSKCTASPEIWQIYTHMRSIGIAHCQRNGLARVNARHAKQRYRSEVKALYDRLSDETDPCTDLIGDGMEKGLLDESQLIDRLTKKHETGERYKTNWKCADEIMYNFSPGDVMLLCGLSNTGKTSVALQLSYFAKHRTLYYGVDMSIEALGERILKTCWYRDNVGLWEKNTRIICDKVTEKAVKDKKARIENGIRVYDSDRMTLEQIEYSAKNELETFAADVLIIDYTGRIESDSESRDEWREEQRIARSIKGMAKRLNIRVIALAQFNSKAEKFKKPENSWISGSKELISACDVVLCLWQNKNSDGTIDYTRLNLSDDIKNRDSGTHGDYALNQFGTWLYEGNDFE